MHFLIALIVCPVLIFLVYFTGNTITKKLNIKEENQLFSVLIKIALGLSLFLIVINLISKVIRDFNIGILVTFVAILALLIWQLQELKQVFSILKEFLSKDKLSRFIKENTDRYFWLVFGFTNLIYGITAFSTTKLGHFGTGNSYINNVNQILNGVYPPKSSLLLTGNTGTSDGIDLVGALISKFSALHPEITLDILTLFFLNLSLLLLYALTVKFLDSNKINKYLVPLAAFFAWGPITLLFKTQPGEVLPQKFFEKINYLTQTRLIDSANHSGLVLHWFFAPAASLGSFFFLIALYLLFKFFTEDKLLTFTIVLSVYLSSLLIVDPTRLTLLVISTLVYIFFFVPLPIFDATERNEKAINTLKHSGILFLFLLVFYFINANILGTGLTTDFLQQYSIGKAGIDTKFGPFSCNYILLLIYIFGFYLAYKQKQNWLSFIAVFFAVSIIIPYIVTFPGYSANGILMCGNLLGAFTLPVVFEFSRHKFDLNEQKLKIFYSLIGILLCFNTLMFFAFGDRENPVFKLEEGKLKYTGFQVIPSQPTTTLASEEELPFIKYVKSKLIRNETILTEPQYSDAFYTNTALNTISLPSGIPENLIGKNIRDQFDSDFRLSFCLDKKFWQDKKISWIYMTPRMFRFMFPPQARMKLLNAYLNKGVKLEYSNKKIDDPSVLKELYKVNPGSLSNTPSKNFSGLLEQLLSSNNEHGQYLKQIAECPYFGIYNAMSNDFDGDMIADIAFFDQANKKWYIIYGKDQKEDEIDLSQNLLKDYNGTDLLIPIPSDYDGDGKTDVALFDNTSRLWYVLRSSDSKVATVRKGCIDFGEVPIPADLDGDSKTDISCYGSPYNNWAALITSTNFGYQAKRLDSAPIDTALLADIDGDNKADNVVYRPPQQKFYLYLTSKTNNLPFQINLGEPNSRIILDDYDGDRKSDIATWNPDSGKWEIIFAKDILQAISQTNNPSVSTLGCGIARNSITGTNDMTSCKSKTFTLGEPGDIPMPGDYDGDGKSDIAVFHTRTLELESISFEGIYKKIDLSSFKNMTPANIIGI